MRLVDAITTNDTVTENGAVAHSTTGSECLNMFFHINAMLSYPTEEIINLFVKAFHEDALTAMRILFYSRDVRQGQGERQVFRTLIKHAAHNYTDALRKNINLIPHYGRWDDVLELFDTPLEHNALVLIATALYSEDNALCAKWMPREKSSRRSDARKIRNHMGLTPKQYRKLLANSTKVVESKMCANKWELIEYPHVPSRAMMIYRNAFERHDPKRWNEYVDAVQKGITKVNASTLYPHDIVNKIERGQHNRIIIEQWNALPNYMEGSTTRILPVCDVSSSMDGLPMLVSMALGVYISERNVGPFQNYFMTFSMRPQLLKTSGTILDRYRQIKDSPVGYNTNIEAVFTCLLNAAINQNVPESEMPEKILLLSDMQFDSATGHPDKSIFKNIKFKYEAAGYKMPQIVFWNLRAVVSNNPVKADDRGVAMVSGFSPSIMKRLLSSEDMSPIAIMNSTVHAKWYSPVQI